MVVSQFKAWRFQTILGSRRKYLRVNNTRHCHPASLHRKERSLHTSLFYKWVYWHRASRKYEVVAHAKRPMLYCLRKLNEIDEVLFFQNSIMVRPQFLIKNYKLTCRFFLPLSSYFRSLKSMRVHELQVPV